MIQPNGQNGNGSAATIQEPAASETVIGTPAAGDALGQGPELATRAKQRTRQQIQQNRFVIIAAGAIVVALLIFVATSMPSKRSAPKSKNGTAAATPDATSESGTTPGDKSLFPITDSGRPVAKETHEGFLNERDLQRTATGGQLPVRLVQDREIQTERWHPYRPSEISRTGKRRLTSRRQAQTMRLTYLTQARRSAK